MALKDYTFLKRMRIFQLQTLHIGEAGVEGARAPQSLNAETGLICSYLGGAEEFTDMPAHLGGLLDDL